MKRGFTLIETVTVMAIAMITIAFLFPVFARAKRSAKITASASILRQLHLSTKLYQFEYDGDGRYGDLPEMGLPSAARPLDVVSPTHRLELPSPCGQNPNWMPEPLAFDYIYRPGTGGQKFASIAQTFRESLLLFFDPNCDEPDAYPIWSEHKVHFGIGVLLSGQSVRKRALGKMYFDDYWWSQPPTE